jgi:hypothetical protein
MKSEHINVMVVGGVIIVLLILYFLYKKNQENLDIINENDTSDDETNKINETNVPILGVYYTEWCGYSQRFLRELKEEIIPSLEQNKLDKEFQIKLVDCEKHKEECEKNNVPGFPTLILHKGAESINYEGDRSASDLISFLKRKL